MSLVSLDAIRQAIAEADPLPLTGTVVRAAGLVLEAALPRVPVGTACEIRATDGAMVLAEVVGFFGQTARLMPLADIHGIGEGCTVVPRAAADRIPVGHHRLLVEYGQYEPYNSAFELRPGHRLEVDVALRPPPPLGRAEFIAAMTIFGALAVPMGLQAIGAVTTSDVMLVAASSGVIIAFNVPVESSAESLAQQEGVDVRSYNIIYKLIEDIDKALKGMLEPVYKDVQTGRAQEGQAATEDLMTIIENNPDLSAYAMALKASGHDQKLTGEEPYMVFAPTDDAVKRDLGYTNATTLSSAGKYLLEGTIVQNPQAPSEGSKQTMLTSINGKRIDVVKSDSQVMANGVKITTAIPATNGILVITDGIV